MHLIPAIDIIDGKCVRLEQGSYDLKTEYHSDPVEVARKFEDAGLSRLHLVDLDGAKASKVINWPVLKKITTATNLIIDFGGGIKRKEDLDVVFDNGAVQATVGSIAAEKPELFHDWLDHFGVDRIILGADLKEGRVATRGWMETSGYSWQEFLALHLKEGVKTVVCTDVSKDGMLQGPSLDLYKDILHEFPGIQLVASGGVSSMKDLELLRSIGCYAAIIGKAIYENRISLKELQAFNHVG